MAPNRAAGALRSGIEPGDAETAVAPQRAGRLRLDEGRGLLAHHRDVLKVRGRPANRSGRIAHGSAGGAKTHVPEIGERQDEFPLPQQGASAIHSAEDIPAPFTDEVTLKVWFICVTSVMVAVN